MSYRVQFPAAVDSFGLSTDNATRNASIVDGYPTLECALYAIPEIEMRLGTGPLAVEYGGTGVASLEELALVALPASSDSRAYLRRVGGDLSFDIPTVLGESAATLGNLDVAGNFTVGGTLFVTSTSSFGDKITTEHVQVQDGYYLAVGETQYRSVGVRVRTAMQKSTERRWRRRSCASARRRPARPRPWRSPRRSTTAGPGHRIPGLRAKGRGTPSGRTAARGVDGVRRSARGARPSRAGRALHDRNRHDDAD